MNLSCVLHLLGRLCTVLAALLLLPLLVCLHDGTLDGEIARTFTVTALGTLALAVVLRLAFRFRPERFHLPEAFAIVIGAWIVFPAIGAVPFILAGKVPSVVDALFESVSGATTCGASILADPAALGRPLLLWRALLHLVGGIGIVALYVAVLPALGAGGNFLFHAEASGPEQDKLLPRISTMSKLLWAIYLGLTLLNVGALWVAGMGPFDAVCHAFATVATGGFGTRADSLASYSAPVQWVTVLFMFLAGTNFVLLLSAVRGHAAAFFHNTEWRVYACVMLSVSAVCVLVRLSHGATSGSVEEMARGTVFSVVSLGSTTGFTTEDYDAWPAALHLLLMLSMFVGACAGSTSGANKVSRLILWWKAAGRELRRLVRPSAVFVVKVEQRTIADRVVIASLAFLFLYMLFWVLGSLALIATGLGPESAISSVLTCLSGVGPGFDAVGPTHNFAALAVGGKVVLMAMMLLGRLEFFSVLVLLSPWAWRR